MKFIGIRIEDDLHHKFRIELAKQKTKATEILPQLIEDWINKTVSKFNIAGLEKFPKMASIGGSILNPPIDAIGLDTNIKEIFNGKITLTTQNSKAAEDLFEDENDLKIDLDLDEHTPISPSIIKPSTEENRVIDKELPEDFELEF